MTQPPSGRPIALVTGASRSKGIGAEIASSLAESGWDVATTFWRPYDATMPWGDNASEADEILNRVRRYAQRAIGIEANLSDTDAPARIFDSVEGALGPVTALVMAHCHSVDSSIRDTSITSFDLHYAVNARAPWLLIREFCLRYRSGHGNGRIVAITSDDTVGNLPYGASKGAMDRIVLAAAQELKALGVSANVVNPGATDTGWISEEQMRSWSRSAPLGRIGVPRDCANLVKFLCSQDGGWVNGQLLHSNGGVK